MASSLLALLDDITTLLDDVATLTKVAAKKTSGVLGDDLALNAQQVTGVGADRELPVVWAVAKGSLLNKLILVPAALIISSIAPWAVVPLLMIGGAYLCYEGVEKLAHRYLPSTHEDDAHRLALARAVTDANVDLLAVERDKIKGAIRTDFILSAEIVVISLGTVADQPFGTRLAVLSGLALLMTVGVYGLVAGIVKLDDGGLHLLRKAGDGAWRAMQRALGRVILRAAPILMKTLSVAGTIAMFLVGGGILVHGIPPIHHLSTAVANWVSDATGLVGVVPLLSTSVLDALVGILAGAVVLALVIIGTRTWRRVRASAAS